MSLLPQPPTSSINIEVSKPTQVGSGVGSYITYQVATHRISQVDHETKIVTRRFNDFVWLREQLTATHAWVFIPALPKTNDMLSITSRVGYFNQDAIKGRSDMLQRFLQRIARHYSLRASPELRCFLEADDENFTTIKAEKPKKGGGISGFFASFNFLAVPKGPASADVETADARAYLSNLKDELRATKHLVRTYLGHRAAMQQSQEVLGLKMIAVATYEATAKQDQRSTPPALTMLGWLGEAISHEGKAVGEHVPVQQKELLVYLDDIIRVIEGGLDCYSRRADMMYEMANLRAEIERKRLRPGSDGEIAQMQARVDMLSSTCQVGLQALKDEMARFDAEVAKEFPSCVKKYSGSCVENADKVQRIWSDHAASLQLKRVESQDEGGAAAKAD